MSLIDASGGSGGFAPLLYNKCVARSRRRPIAAQLWCPRASPGLGARAKWALLRHPRPAWEAGRRGGKLPKHMQRSLARVRERMDTAHLERLEARRVRGRYPIGGLLGGH